MSVIASSSDDPELRDLFPARWETEEPRWAILIKLAIVNETN